jgi:hypothetical protein
MGWNTVRFVQPGSPLTAGLATEGEEFLFRAQLSLRAGRSGAGAGGMRLWRAVFTAAIARGRCFATQFHPEKSQAKGIQLYRNFARWRHEAEGRGFTFAKQADATALMMGEIVRRPASLLCKRRGIGLVLPAMATIAP